MGQADQGEIRELRERLSRLSEGAVNPTYIFTEPRVGYRMAKGEGQEREEAQ